MEIFEITTKKTQEFIDITSEVQKIIKNQGWNTGVLMAYVPHTTAGLTINEHADPTVKSDIIAGLDQLIHDERIFRHQEGNSPAHFKASLMGASQQIIVENGRLVLGTWQGIFFTEFDGPRRRKVFLRFLDT